jgi:hypothetical protein
LFNYWIIDRCHAPGIAAGKQTKGIIYLDSGIDIGSYSPYYFLFIWIFYNQIFINKEAGSIARRIANVIDLYIKFQ